MHAALHNYRVAGKLYDRTYLASINFLSLSLSLSPPNKFSNRYRDRKRLREMDPPGTEKADDILLRAKERQVAESRCGTNAEIAQRSLLVRFYRFPSEPPDSVHAILSPVRLSTSLPTIFLPSLLIFSFGLPSAYCRISVNYCWTHGGRRFDVCIFFFFTKVKLIASCLWAIFTFGVISCLIKWNHDA